MNGGNYMREKLGFWRKTLGKVGKRVMWHFSKKVNRLLLHASWKEVLLSFASLPGSDSKIAYEIWYNLGKGAGESLVYAWQDRIKMLFSQNIADMKEIVTAAWYSFLGDNPDELEFYEAGDGHEAARVIWRFHKCWICSQILEDPDCNVLIPAQEGELGYGSCACGIFESALQQVQDYVGNPYQVVVRETKCFHRGDNIQEFTAFFYPKEE